MKFKAAKLAPALIAVCVVAVVCIFRIVELDFFERLERITYDIRVRDALKFPATAATNLGFVFIDDQTISFVATNRAPGPTLGYRFGLLWPRQVYARIVSELAAQGAKAVAFDVLFDQLREDHSRVIMADNISMVDSDDYFATQLQRVGNVILADSMDLHPHDLFATNALALGDITTDTKKDSDGVLRRAHAFRTDQLWHPALRQVEVDPGYGVNLDRAWIDTNAIVLPRANGDEIRIPLDSAGTFDPRDLWENLPPELSERARPFTERRVWHMGLVLAAQELGMDLNSANVDLSRGRIELRTRDGSARTIPVDRNGYFYIDWCVAPNDPRLIKQTVMDLLLQERRRLEGRVTEVTNRYQGKLVIVGSSATGNDLTDRGATPLEKDTLLASGHWNVANSLLTGRFVRRSSLGLDLALITVLGLLAAVLTWRLRALVALFLVTVSIVGYVAIAWSLYIQQRLWIPVILPVMGAQLMTYMCLVTWRVVFEQADMRRVKSIFSTVVSPKIMNELIKAEKLSLVGARREVTVMFADVRGFTELTDLTQERVATYVSENNLSGAAAEKCFDEQARETLGTINLYLGLVAETILRHDATLDKFIGDCVMAFWGAPTANPQHACACVRAAIEVQRAIAELNQKRSKENELIEAENRNRIATGEKPKSLLPILQLGSGINTGMVTVGLMGSEAQGGVHQANYTVFGREVNVASRLEGLSGRGRIFISDATYQHLLRDEPALARKCIRLAAEKVKGIRTAVEVYEVPWNDGGSAPLLGSATVEQPRPVAGYDSELKPKGESKA